MTLVLATFMAIFYVAWLLWALAEIALVIERIR